MINLRILHRTDEFPNEIKSLVAEFADSAIIIFDGSWISIFGGFTIWYWYFNQFADLEKDHLSNCSIIKLFNWY